MLPTKLAESKTPTALCEPVCYRYVCASAFPRPVSRRIRSVPFIREACRRPADYSARTSAGVEPTTFEKRAVRAGTQPTALTAPQLLFATARLLMLQLAISMIDMPVSTCSFPLVCLCIYTPASALSTNYCNILLIHPHPLCECETRHTSNV